MRARAHLFAGFPSSPSECFLRGEARVIRQARLTPDCACFISRVLVSHFSLQDTRKIHLSFITGDCRARCETIKLWQKPNNNLIIIRVVTHLFRCKFLFLSFITRRRGIKRVCSHCALADRHSRGRASNGSSLRRTSNDIKDAKPYGFSCALGRARRVRCAQRQGQPQPPCVTCGPPPRPRCRHRARWQDSRRPQGGDRGYLRCCRD